MSGIELLLSQAWVDRLGWTLIHFLWQGALTAALYAAARSWIRQNSGANARYVLACTTLAVMVALPLVTFTSMPQSGPVRIQDPIPEKIQSTAKLTASLQTPQSKEPVAGDSLERLLPMVVLVWLSGAVAFWIRLAGGWLLTTRLQSKSVRPAPAEWQNALN